MSVLSLSRDGRLAIGQGPGRSLMVWDAETGTVIHTLTAHIRTGEHQWGMQAVKMTADGSRAMSSGINNPLIVWDVASGSIICQIENRKINPRTADLSVDGGRAACGCGNRFPRARRGLPVSSPSPLVVWDLESGVPPRQLDGHGGGITRISLSADGHRALTCALDCAVVYWDLESRTVIRRLTGHKEWLWSVALSLDEGYALSGGADQKMILWNMEAGEAVTWLYLNGRIAALDWAGNRIGVDCGVVHFLEMES
jgi:WD40 repeat protein